MESLRNDPLAATDGMFNAARIAQAVPPAIQELQKAEERVLSDAIRLIDGGEMTPDRALQVLITLSVQRNLRRKLQKAAQMAETDTRADPSAFNLTKGA